MSSGMVKKRTSTKVDGCIKYFGSKFSKTKSCRLGGAADGTVAVVGVAVVVEVVVAAGVTPGTDRWFSIDVTNDDTFESKAAHVTIIKLVNSSHSVLFALTDAFKVFFSFLQ
jgi:hypothetical protein